MIDSGSKPVQNSSISRWTGLFFLCKVAFTDDERLIGEAAKNQVRNGRSENLRWESRNKTSCITS